MNVIKKGGEKLIESLGSLYPSCQTPGFSLSKGIAGLPFEECGILTSITKNVIWNCVNC